MASRRRSAAPTAPAAPIRLTVDARDAAAGKIKSHLVVPARPGELRLVYPKWVPGEHGPSGPIADVVDLRISAGGSPLAWHRNPDDMFEVVVTVPAGAAAVEVDFVSLRTASAGFGASAAASPHFVDVVWNQAVVYPKGLHASAVLMEPTVILPKGWTT